MVISLCLNQRKSDTLRKGPKESARKYNFGLEIGKLECQFFGMDYYYNTESNTMNIHSTTDKGFPFVLSIHHKDDGHTVKSIGFTWPEHTCPDGQTVGSISTGFRVKCWGEIFYRLTRGKEIPRNWWTHNEA